MTKNRVSREWLTCALLFALIFMQGCSPDYAEQVGQQKQVVAAKLEALGSKITAGQLSNALLIGTYSDSLARSKPELKPIIDLLRKDSTTSGPLYQSLKERLAAVNNTPGNEAEFALVSDELFSLDAASDQTIFNDGLLDVVNTLADLSDRELPRINIPQNALTANLKGEAVPGSYLVGNPSYGRWRNDSGGRSFWEFYGQYRLFSDLFRGPGYYRGPIGYDSWYGGRTRYSYYNDYGRSTYGRGGDRSFNQGRRSEMRSKGLSVPAPAKQYGSAAGNARVSNYSQARTSRTPGASKRQSNLFGSSARGSRARGK